jgi:hypothetical protein
VKVPYREGCILRLSYILSLSVYCLVISLVFPIFGCLDFTGVTGTVDAGQDAVVSPDPEDIFETVDADSIDKNPSRRDGSQSPALRERGGFKYPAECVKRDDHYLVHEQGPLVAGKLSISDGEEKNQIARNTKTLNAAVAEIGKKGGGTICVPKGRFEIKSPDIRSEDGPGAALNIQHSNIELRGAGRNDDGEGTGIYTNGKYWVVDGEVRRGHGLRIATEISDVVLRDFELNGQGALPGDETAWTGNKNWPADPETGDGWDVSHKGLIVGWGPGVLEDLRVKNIAVRSYKGEMIYQGGRSLRDAEFINIVSEDTNAQAWNVHGDNVTVRDSYFGLSNQWFEIESLWGEDFIDGTAATYRNNQFEKCDGIQCISIAQGDNSEVPYLFEDNSFSGCNFREDKSGAVLGLGKATGGPVKFRDNKLRGCYPARPIATGGNYSGPISNVIIENNDVRGVTNSQFIFLWRNLKDWQIRKNRFESDPENPSRMVHFGGGHFDGVIEQNTFVNEGGPANHGSDPSMMPVFRDNSYSHGQTRWGVHWVSSDGEKIMPLYEHVDVAAPDNYDPTLRTDIYPDGFTTTIRVIPNAGARSDLIFKPGADSYSVDEKITLTKDGGETLTLIFDGDKQKWVQSGGD